MQETRVNEFGQRIGHALPGWTAPVPPDRVTLSGRYVDVAPFDLRFTDDLFAAYVGDPSAWTYLPYGPFSTIEDYRRWVAASCFGVDPLFYAIVGKDGRARGTASYLRIMPASASIEVGHLHFSSALRRTPHATEAMFLMMKWAFEHGYRRYEWKCDALNAPSRAAAQRLGFSFEGIFRQATVYKQRSRDTAWYAIVDSEWPALEEAFHAWLAPENFDAGGRQRVRLTDSTAPLLVSRG